MQRVGCTPAAKWAEKISAKAVAKPVGSVAKQISALYTKFALFFIVLQSV